MRALLNCWPLATWEPAFFRPSPNSCPLPQAPRGLCKQEAEEATDTSAQTARSHLSGSQSSWTCWGSRAGQAEGANLAQTDRMRAGSECSGLGTSRSPPLHVCAFPREAGPTTIQGLTRRVHTHVPSQFGGYSWRQRQAPKEPTSPWLKAGTATQASLPGKGGKEGQS